MKRLRKVFQRPGRRVMGAFSDEGAKASRHLDINVQDLLDKFDTIEFDISPNYYLKVAEGLAVRQLGLVENMLITGINEHKLPLKNYAETLKSNYEYQLLKELKAKGELNSLIFEDEGGFRHILSYPLPGLEEDGVPIRIRGNILVVPNSEDLGDKLKAGWILVGVNGVRFNDRDNIINAFKELLEYLKDSNVTINIIQSEEDIRTDYNPLLTLAGINTGSRRYRKRTHHKKSKKHHKKSKKQHKKSKPHRKRNNKKTHRKY